MAETLPTKSMILIKSSKCIQESQNQECKELISQIEELKSLMFDQNRFKCQSSLLGLQSELIEAHFLKKNTNSRVSIMIPYVNKNC